MFGFKKSSSKSASPVSRRCVVEGLERRELHDYSGSGPIAWAVTDQRELIRMDVNSGQAFYYGRTQQLFYDVAVSKSGALYGITSSSALYQINPNNAATKYIGSLGRFANALTFGPDGRLYAAGHNQLMTVNTSNGSSYLIGTFNNLNSAGDLAFDNKGYLYMTTTTDKLIRVNLSARTYRTIGSLGFHNAYGLSSYHGQVYGFSNSDGNVYRINLSTGHGTALAYYKYDGGGVNGTDFNQNW